MSIKHSVLALLSQQPMGVYQLRKEFESRTGGTWPLNIGQVYSTVQRLERDQMVAALPAQGSEDVERFALTDAGAASAKYWWTSPVLRGTPERDELVIKLALAVTVPEVDVHTVVQAQRRETMRALRDFTRLKAAPDGDAKSGPDLAWSFVLDHHIFAAEAEIRWLDHIEADAARAHRSAAGASMHLRNERTEGAGNELRAAERDAGSVGLSVADPDGAQAGGRANSPAGDSGRRQR